MPPRFRALLIAGCVTAATLAFPLAARAVTINYTLPCVASNFVVPPGVTSVFVEAWGAQGGSSEIPDTGVGGLGGAATATLAVTPDETLQVAVGGIGGNGDITGVAGAAGCNGGGSGGPGSVFSGGGGGGASHVHDGSDQLNRTVVAGGGGGTGGIPNGGDGGGLEGDPGEDAITASTGGTGGTQIGGGIGGSPGGVNGMAGSGGAGCDATAGGMGGGGGGGGFFGGGGGGCGGLLVGGAGGGGGGSGFVFPGAGGTLEGSVQAGNGLVRISYTVTTAVTVRSLSATATAGGVRVRWSTASERDSLGFRVYRQVNRARVRISGLLPARGGTAAASYSFLDRRAPKGSSVRYWIQEVGVDGSRSWYGPARVSRRI